MRWGLISLVLAACGSPGDEMGMCASCGLPEEAVCGDGILQVDAEPCDPTTSRGDGCRADCALPVCGDGAYAAGDVCFEQGERLLELSLLHPRLELVDIDGDGALDLVLSRHGPDRGIEIAFNDGSALFTPTSLIVPSDVGAVAFATGDLDDDGDVDVAIADGDQLYIANNEGARALVLSAPVTVNAGWAVDLEVGDFTGDGVIDVATGNSTTIGVIPGGGVLPFGTIQYQASVKGSELATGDFDGNGVLDVVALDGELTFAFADRGLELVTQAAGTIGDVTQDLRVIDLDGDGRLDLLAQASTMNSGLQTHVLLARADRTSFETHVVGGTRSPVPVDVDGDGHLDLVGLGHASDWNDGVPGAWSTEVVFGIGGGAFSDALVPHVYLGSGDGSALLGDHRGFRDLRAGDLDGDGALDLVALGGTMSWLFDGFELEAVRIQRGNP